MGSDNLFHKRKAKKLQSLRRRQARREPYDVVLIVCEGEKSETNYFNGLKNEFRLNNANIEICGLGCDPLNLVKHAIARLRENKEFDRVYCVFDRDRHKTYKNALNKVRNTTLGGRRKIEAITSVPCFEYWLLLHFTYTTAPASNCSPVIERLKSYWYDYEKTDKRIFDKIKDKLDKAITNARQVEQYHKTSGTDNPSTRVHHLVDYLRTLKQR